MIKLLVAVACFVVVAMPVIQAQTMYSTKYDHVNVEEILKNDRLLNNYLHCLMETGKCTAEGEFLKKILPEAVETKCAYCSEKQKNAFPKIIKYLIKNKNDVWKQLEGKFDPQGTYRQRYQEDVKQLLDSA